jgi:hypothetical protein
VIDYPELVDLGFDVELFPENERSLISDLRPLVEGGPLSLIQVVEPEVAGPESPPVDGNGGTSATATTVKAEKGTG